jgi:hypothetical protein
MRRHSLSALLQTGEQVYQGSGIDKVCFGVYKLYVNGYVVLKQTRLHTNEWARKPHQKSNVTSNAVCGSQALLVRPRDSALGLACASPDVQGSRWYE